MKKKNKKRLCGTYIKHRPKWNNNYTKLMSRRRAFYSVLDESWGDTWWCRTSAGIYFKLRVREYSITNEPYAVPTTSIEADILEADTRCMGR